MPFINEYIPEEDKKKYNMTDENNFYRAGASQWTVDRERDMFLLPRTGQSPESVPGQMSWAFLWRGHLLDVLLYSFPVDWNETTGLVKARKKILELNLLSSELATNRQEIIGDLKNALIANLAFGLVPENMTYELILDAE